MMSHWKLEDPALATALLWQRNKKMLKIIVGIGNKNNSCWSVDN